MLNKPELVGGTFRFWTLRHSAPAIPTIAFAFVGGATVTTPNNVIAIGTARAKVSDSCFSGNIFGATFPNGVGVFVTSNEHLEKQIESLAARTESKCTA